MSECPRQKQDCDANFYLAQDYYELREWLLENLPEGSELLDKFDARVVASDSPESVVAQNDDGKELLE